MTATAATAGDVLAGKARWSATAARWEDFIPSLPDDSIDLLVTSPPYEKAREYGEIKFELAGEAWVEWMMAFVRAAQPKVKGLIAINCEGQTKNYSYSAVPFLLVADLKRAGFNLRKPAAYEREGIPGSGGPDWLKNRWEPIICVSRPGPLPWSDNTACGSPPKWDVGGDVSHRDKKGDRVNEKRKKMKELVSTGISQREAARRAGVPMVYTTSGVDNNGVKRGKFYVSPDLTNPGNVIKCNTGGGHLGHPIAHDNDAPFPVELPAFFIKSFCPPDGVVLDPFLGSGTTIQAAVECGRRAIGCDIRESQAALTRRRMRTVTPSMPGTA